MDQPLSTRMASAASQTVGEFKGKTKVEEWQAEAYGHVNAIGELGYVLGVHAVAVADGALVVVEEDENGVPVEPRKRDDGTPIIEGDRAAAERVLRFFRGPDGDHHALIERLAWHDPVAGEALLLGEPIKATSRGRGRARKGSGLAWEVVSVLEIVREDKGGGSGKLVRKRSAAQSTMSVAARQAPDSDLDPNTYISRYHRRDLAYSGDATSALRRNAGVCREIVLLDQLKEVLIKQRLSAGVFLVPEEVDFPSPDDEGVDEPDDASRFLEMLLQHLSAPVEDRKSATSLVPLTIRVPADMIEKFRLMSLADEVLDLSTVKDARDDALSRLAAGIDVPPERMTGMGSMNHWTGALLSDDEIQKHVIPLGDRIARFVTNAYFRKMLIEFEDFDDEKAERFRLEYRAPETRMDKAASADTLYADGHISSDTRVEAHGFDPDMVRPDDDERTRRFLMELAGLANGSNKPLIAALIEFSGIDLPEELLEKFLTAPTVPGEASDGQDDTPDDDEQPAQPGGPPVQQDDTPGGPTQPATGEPGLDGTDAELTALVQIRTAASAVVDRALERAANQVLTNAKRLGTERRAVVEEDKYRTARRKPEVLQLLTRDDWRAIKRTPEALLRGAFADFEHQATAWLRGYYETVMDSTAADEAARRAATQLCTELDTLALTAFTRPLDRTDGLVVPMDLVRGCVAVRTPR